MLLMFDLQAWLACRSLTWFPRCSSHSAYQMKKTLLLLLTFVSLAVAQPRWVATWTTSPAPQLAAAADMRNANMLFQNQTFREIVHTSIGGDAVRVRISNVYASAFLQVGAVHLALRTQDSAILPESDRPLTFSGRSSVSVPPGAVMISDPISFPVPADGDLVISIFLPTASSGAGITYTSYQTNYIGDGDQTGTATFQATTTVNSWAFLAGVDVIVPDGGTTIVACCDSYTTGGKSTVGANHRWPNYLASRLLAAGVSNISVVNAGIGGNRILHDDVPGFTPLSATQGVSGLARFERDVLAVPGAKWVIILAGTTDYNLPGSSAPLSEMVSADDIIVGLQQMAARAHEMGLKVIGCTLPPFVQSVSSPDREAIRISTNGWIRSTDVFDAIVDFDLLLRDPDHPNRLLPAYDSGDHTHPSELGYQVMASIIDLKLFQ